MKKLAHARSNIDVAGNFFIILCCFFIPFSTSLMGATAVLAACCWILSGRLFSLPRLMIDNTLVLLAIVLFLLLVAGLFYAPVPMDEALSTLKKYRELIYFAMVVSFMADNDNAAKLAENSFILGCIVLLLISYSIFFSIIPSERYGHSVVYHITHNYFMAILAFWCLQRAFGSRQYAYLWLALFVITTINLFYIAPGRTGMLVFVALILLTLFQHLSFTKSIVATLLVSLVIGITFVTSTNFSTRVREAVDEIKNYQAESSRTSLGMRFDWWQNSLQLIEQKPVFGHGTGSFKAVQAELIKDSDTKPTDNPHNEYLMIGVQTGLLGLALWLALLVAQFIASFRLQPPGRYLLQGVVVAMASGCLMNSFLLDSHQGHFYAILSAILLCTQTKKNGQLISRR
jgi:O-antigen ligase